MLLEIVLIGVGTAIGWSLNSYWRRRQVQNLVTTDFDIGGVSFSVSFNSRLPGWIATVDGDRVKAGKDAWGPPRAFKSRAGALRVAKRKARRRFKARYYIDQQEGLQRQYRQTAEARAEVDAAVLPLRSLSDRRRELA